MGIRYPQVAIGGQKWVENDSIGGLIDLEVSGQAQGGRKRLIYQYSHQSKSKKSSPTINVVNILYLSEEDINIFSRKV
jgi:hypothetical protein